MADLKLQEAEMRTLRDEITLEVEMVEKELDNIYQIMTSDPVGDDTILNGIYEVGLQLNESWSDLIKTFKTIGEGLGNIIGNLAKEIAKQMDNLRDMKTGN